MTDLHFVAISLASSFAILLIIHLILKNSHPIFRSITNCVIGTISIVLASTAQSYTGIKFPLNEFSLSVSCTLGLPGIGLLAIFNTIFL